MIFVKPGCVMVESVCSLMLALAHYRMPHVWNAKEGCGIMEDAFLSAHSAMGSSKLTLINSHL